MDRNMDYNGYYSQGFPFGYGMDMNYSQEGENPMFNPIMQYEQGYMYYRYLTMQLEYKIKCKEYEKLCSNGNTRPDRKIE